MSTSEIIIIGDEILHGETKDTNGPWLIEHLNNCDVEVEALHIIPDHLETISELIQQCSSADYVLISGGIGPTHDDKTRQAIGRALSRPLVEHQEVVPLLEAHYGDELNRPRRELALLPKDTEIIYLPKTPAIAFRTENIYAFPGVPQMLRPLFKKWGHRFSGKHCFTDSVTIRAREGDIAEKLSELQRKYPDLQFACYPHGATISLTVRGHNKNTFNSGCKDLLALAAPYKTE